MPRSAALPFTLTRSDDVMSGEGYTSTVETVHGLLHLHDEHLVVQWRLTRTTDRMGEETRTDRETGEVREVVIPLSGLAGAVVRERRWLRFLGPRFILTAADLRAFEALAGPTGLGTDHPARLELKLRRADRLDAHDFAAELALALAELPPHRRDAPLPAGPGATLPPPSPAPPPSSPPPPSPPASSPPSSPPGG